MLFNERDRTTIEIPLMEFLGRFPNTYVTNGTLLHVYHTRSAEVFIHKEAGSVL